MLRQRGRRSRADGVRGFTLVELLVAISIIGILLLPLLNVLSRQVRTERDLRDMQIALALAQDAMEQMQNLPMREDELKDREFFIELQGTTWRIVRDVIDGEEEDEPLDGTDPLEIWIQVYKGESPTAIAELAMLKEDWQGSFGGAIAQMGGAGGPGGAGGFGTTSSLDWGAEGWGEMGSDWGSGGDWGGGDWGGDWGGGDGGGGDWGEWTFDTTGGWFGGGP